MSSSELPVSKKFDHIPNRIEFINNLLKGGQLQPMIIAEKCDTEQIENSKGNNDIRNILSKKLVDFNFIINEIGGKLLYVKSGTTGHTFKGISYTDPQDKSKCVNYAVKVVAYLKRDNYGNIHDPSRPENAELVMLRLLSYFVVNNQSPHIVLPIATFNTSIKPFISLAKEYKDNKKFEQFIKRYKNSEYHDEVSVLISEWANGGDLLDYIRNNYKIMKLKEWRIIFFQILSVLAVIQSKYPTFRHNDMKANNILIQLSYVKDKNVKFRYEINNTNYYVPNIGTQIKIWDFDFACIPGIVNNSKVDADWTKKINIKPCGNKYYDLHYFFNTLTRPGFFPEFWESKEIPSKVKDFIKRVIPEKYRDGKYVSEKGRILVDKEYTTPDELLKYDKFFEKMRKN